ncbi:DUF6656 family protein [Rhizobium sp. AAP43]|uniref:DUF6656 family protein n=1 Tax=Rhizobium sp. AAP43 TaxID=1523420 RepID=UPI0006B88910|nr:DUF6656 family protein [Rhizobium sp. AAP43]KPF46734.1 hypothetical protein IP76_02265 [Rhizobium sp. AAP43]
MQKHIYFETARTSQPARNNKASDYLRHGPFAQHLEDWVPDERRYLTYEEVAERTGRRLEAAGAKTHKQINSFHRSIQFPKMIFHRTLDEIPHLGYCHVTAAHTSSRKFSKVRWAFYIANFQAEIGDDRQFFRHIKPNYDRMYFAVAIRPDKEASAMTLDKSVRDNGLLFNTRDPKQALKNVLMLGARDEALRAIIAKM